MICHDKKFIFVHIPKCGGTSISNALNVKRDHGSIKMIQPLDINLTYYFLVEFFNFLRRLRYLRNNKKLLIDFSTKNYYDYFKFSIVRNPWSRAFSWYNNVMRDENHKRNLNLDSKISFEEFLNKFICKGMLRPQTFWLENFQGQIKLDFIGKFESLQKDFEYICDILNLDKFMLEKRNTGPKINYRDFYNLHTKKMIEKKYAFEIDYFKYTFDK